jgi:hypothetical protein
MGYQVILDLVGSAIIGGALLLTLLGFSASNHQAKQEYQAEMLSQENIISVTDAMEEDLRQAGYCKNKTAMSGPVIVSAGSDYIAFKTDVPTQASREGDGSVDTISYKLIATSVPNSPERKLVRRANSGEFSPFSRGITQFDLKYYKYNGDTLSRPVAPARLKEITRIEMILGMGSFSASSQGPSANASTSVKTLRYELKNFGKGAI